MTEQPAQQAYGQYSAVRWYGAATHPGGREYNEDAAVVVDFSTRASHAYGALLVVADGIGGHQAGDVASRLAVESLQVDLDPNRFEDEAEFRRTIASLLQASIASVNQRLHEMGRAGPGERGPGTTLTCAAIDSQDAWIAHVGDSRAYHVTADGARALTEDHSVVGAMLAEGVITEEQARVHEQRNIITRAVGPDPEVEVDLLRVPMRPGELLLLCTDGLHTAVSREEIAYVMTTVPDVQQACETLVSIAVSRATGDNATAVAWRMLPAGPEPEAEAAPRRHRAGRERRLPRWAVALLAALFVLVGAGAGWFVASFWYGNEQPKESAPVEKKLPPRPGYKAGDQVVVASQPAAGGCYLYDFPDERRQGRLYDGWTLEIQGSPRSAGGSWWYRVEVTDPAYTGATKSGYVDAAYLQAVDSSG
ncbi:MAG: protein phosphatase 2C domain-containing protein [Actinomycetota bacterium]